MKWDRGIIIALAQLSLVGVAGAQPLYTVTDLGGLPSGGFSQGRAINNFGQIGALVRNVAVFHAGLWTPTQPNGTAGNLVDLGELPGGNDFSTPWRLNDFGQVVGRSRSQLGQRAFLWTPTQPNGNSGSMVEIIGSTSEAFGINSTGQVVGRAGRAFLWNPTSPNASTGTMVSIGDLPGGIEESTGWGINDRGQVAGVGNAATGQRAFLWTPTVPNGTVGTMVDLGELPGGADFSAATNLNARGQVIGYSSTATGDHAFLWTPDVPNGSSGQMVDLGDLPGGQDFSLARGLNDHGEVVGLSGGSAFLWTQSLGMQDLNFLIPANSGWILREAYGINDHGQIAGWGDLSNHVEARGFLLTPIPEPTSSAIVFLCMLPLTTRRLVPPVTTALRRDVGAAGQL